MSEQVGIRLEVNGWSSAALDDLGLDVYAFRAYHTIARRAGSEGTCYESVENMAKRCQMSERRMRTALRELEKRGLVERIEHSGETSEYRRLMPTVDTAALRGTPARGAAPPRHVVPPTPARGAPKGLPSKDYPLKDEDLTPPTPPSKSESTKRTKFDPLTVSLPDGLDPQAWVDFVQHRREKRKPLTETNTRVLLRELGTLFTADEANDRLRRAVANGWQGVVFSEDRKRGAPAEAAPASEPVKYERWTGADAMAMFDRERARNGGRLT